MTALTLTATELVYGWGRCKRCAWLSAHGKISKPKPVYDFRVANALDKFAKRMITPELLRDAGHECVSASVPDRMSSAPIRFADLGVEVICSGQPDLLTIDTHDMIGVIDIKSKDATARAAEELSAQLHAYLYMIEHPSSGVARQVLSLGLLCWQLGRTPRFTSKGLNLALIGELAYMEIDVDRGRFESLIHGIAQAFARESAPDWGEDCEMCRAARASCAEYATQR